MKKKISIVVPVYNESGSLQRLFEELRDRLNCANYDHDIIFVNDGSTDNSIEIIKSMAAQCEEVKYISFSRNFGKDYALMAGLQHAEGDAVITIDADLQHPPELISEMINLWEEGSEVIYTFRKEDNKHVSLANRVASGIFYKAMNALSDMELEKGISDFRLLDRKVVNVLNTFKEKTPFLRGLVKWVGFKQKGIEYEPNARFAGEAKYSYKALFNLAINSISAFSVKPLMIAIHIGFVSAGISALYFPYVIFSLIFEHPVSGWASVIMSIAFFGGLLLITLGIVGFYLGKLFMQNKERPNFIIDQSNL